MGTKQFVKHYFTGDGQPVNLRDVGLDVDFVQSDSVQNLMSQVDTVVLEYDGSTRYLGTDVTNEPGLYSVGNSSIRVETSCGGVGCTVNYSLRDYFRDPLDIGVEIPGGTPYPINYDWTQRVNVP